MLCREKRKCNGNRFARIYWAKKRERRTKFEKIKFGGFRGSYMVSITAANPKADVEFFILFFFFSAEFSILFGNTVIHKFSAINDKKRKKKENSQAKNDVRLMYPNIIHLFSYSPLYSLFSARDLLLQWISSQRKSSQNLFEYIFFFCFALSLSLSQFSLNIYLVCHYTCIYGYSTKMEMQIFFPS